MPTSRSTTVASKHWMVVYLDCSLWETLTAWKERAGRTNGALPSTKVGTTSVRPRRWKNAWTSNACHVEMRQSFPNIGDRRRATSVRPSCARATSLPQLSGGVRQMTNLFNAPPRPPASMYTAPHVRVAKMAGVLWDLPDGPKVGGPANQVACFSEEAARLAKKGGRSPGTLQSSQSFAKARNDVKSWDRARKNHGECAPTDEDEYAAAVPNYQMSRIKRYVAG